MSGLMKALRGFGVDGAQQARPGVILPVQTLAKIMGRGSAAQTAWPHVCGNVGNDNKSTGCQGLTVSFKKGEKYFNSTACSALDRNHPC